MFSTDKGRKGRVVLQRPFQTFRKNVLMAIYTFSSTIAGGLVAHRFIPDRFSLNRRIYSGGERMMSRTEAAHVDLLDVSLTALNTMRILSPNHKRPLKLPPRRIVSVSTQPRTLNAGVRRIRCNKHDE